MTKEKEEEYALKYYKGSKKFSIFFSVLIMLFGIIVMGVGIFLVCYTQKTVIIVVSIVMVIAGLLDISLGISVLKTNKKRLSNITPSEAAKRYCKIYGIREEKK